MLCRDLTAMRTRDCSFCISHAFGSEKMLRESHSDADDDDDTEAPDDN